MTCGNSILIPTKSKAKPERPERPPGAVLFWHATGRWAKKVHGRLVYFGRGTYDDAFQEYQSWKDKGQQEGEAITVYQLCARFLAAQKRKLETGELAQATWADYVALARRAILGLGRNKTVESLGGDDWARLRARLGKTWGPARLMMAVTKIKAVFNWGAKQKLIRPVNFFDEFNRPSAKLLRKHREAKGPRLFAPADIRAMLGKATQPARSCLYLGLNCGMSNADISALPLSALNLDDCWLTFSRVKTGVSRRIPLWPETVAALKEWLEKAKPATLVFGPKHGGHYLSGRVRGLLKCLGIRGSYYGLRHCLQTVGDETLDFVAVRKIMGHVTQDIADTYREKVGDDRLRRVVDHIRCWLFNQAGQQPAILPMPKGEIA